MGLQFKTISGCLNNMIFVIAHYTEVDEHTESDEARGVAQIAGSSP